MLAQRGHACRQSLALVSYCLLHLHLQHQQLLQLHLLYSVPLSLLLQFLAPLLLLLLLLKACDAAASWRCREWFREGLLLLPLLLQEAAMVLQALGQLLLKGQEAANLLRPTGPPQRRCGHRRGCCCYLLCCCHHFALLLLLLGLASVMLLAGPR
jgi:hypothetical protein